MGHLHHSPQRCLMARERRMEYTGAIDHTMVRGNRGENIVVTTLIEGVLLFLWRRCWGRVVGRQSALRWALAMQ